MSELITDMREHVATLLKGIDRYNPENLAVLESYVEMQTTGDTYDLEANLAVLKLYQFNPHHFQVRIVAQILLMSLANLPHADFTLCKCLIDSTQLDDDALHMIVHMSNLLETCQFDKFWNFYRQSEDMLSGITGFITSIRKFICHVVGNTYQTIHIDMLSELLGQLQEPELNNLIQQRGWTRYAGGEIFIANQDETVKTRNIKETVTFESVAGIMAHAPVIPR